MHAVRRRAVFFSLQRPAVHHNFRRGYTSRPVRCGGAPSFRGAWRRFCAQRFARKCLFACGGGLFACGAYVAVCLFVGWRQAAAVELLFQPQEDYALEEWSQVEPTLCEGDIVLLMGTGMTSWKIIMAQFAYSCMQPAALRYSHVAVVVEPAQLERWPSQSAATTSMETSMHNRSLSPAGTIADILRNERSMLQRKQKRGAVIMEAIDNCDVNAPDVNGKVRHECVQLVEAKHRLFGREGERWCYNRFAVRRLKGFEWTPQRKRLLRAFINENVGRPMDKSPLLVLSFIHPRLYEWTGARATGREVSCGELIVDLYKWCGVIQNAAPAPESVAPGEEGASGGPHDDDSGGAGANSRQRTGRPSVQVAPFHFAEGMEVGVLDFAEGVSLGPEVRVTPPGGQKEATA